MSDINMLRCKITKLAETVMPVVIARKPFCVYGKTGIGKSEVVKYQIAPMLEKLIGMKVIVHDIRLSTKDIMDGTGMPDIDKIARKTYWTQPAFIPDDDGNFHIFFLDEYGHASIQLQHMSYGWVNEGALGEYKNPKHHTFILASNLREDQGGDNEMMQPMQNRIGHIYAEVDCPGFIELTKHWGWDSRLIAFLSLRQDQIHMVSQVSRAFPTPRSLKNLNDVLKSLPPDAPRSAIENATLMYVGEGFNRQFQTFLNNLTAGLPKMPDIKANPKTAKVPDDPHYQWVIGSAVANELTVQNAKHLAQYLQRLMPDVRSMAAHNAMSRDPALGKVWEVSSLVLQ